MSHAPRPHHAPAIDQGGQHEVFPGPGNEDTLGVAFTGCASPDLDRLMLIYLESASTTGLTDGVPYHLTSCLLGKSLTGTMQLAHRKPCHIHSFHFILAFHPPTLEDDLQSCDGSAGFLHNHIRTAGTARARGSLSGSNGPGEFQA